VIRTKWVELEAIKALRTSGIDGPPTSPDRVAERHSIAIRRGVRVPGTLPAHWDPGHGEIRVAAGLEPRLERFPICHELGHALLGHGAACDGYGEPSADDFPLEEADTGIDYEREATYFAACLIVPRDWLKRDITAGRGLAELIARYDAARSTVIIAATTYRLFSKLQP
jgi:Zn-dependent peptidase ImmA (M78 family)